MCLGAGGITEPDILIYRFFTWIKSACAQMSVYFHKNRKIGRKHSLIHQELVSR